MAFVCSANSAFARIKSIMARKRYDWRISLTCGRISLVISVRIRMISLLSLASSSRMRLLASTTSDGSMKTVLPEADSSCTIPLIFRFSPGAMGITNLPSRIVGATSLSTSPSLCAVRKMECNVREILPSVCESSLRMLDSSGEASSRILPNLSNIWSMRWTIFGNVNTSSVKRWRAGYLAFSFSSDIASPFSVRHKNLTILWIVSNDLRKSNKSLISMCTFSNLNLATAILTSKKYCRGKSSSSSCNRRNSFTCNIHSLMVVASSEKAILSTISVPSVDRQLPLIKRRISPNPILPSKFCG